MVDRPIPLPNYDESEPDADEAVESDRTDLIGRRDDTVAQPGVPNQPLARYTAGPQSRPGLEPGLPAAAAADPIAEAIERLRQGQTRFEAHEAEYDRRDQALREEEEKTFKAQEAEAAPIREELSRRIAEPIERPPPLQQLPQPPDLQKTRKEFQDNASSWMFAATAIAMFGAAKSQNAATAGLQAMQGLFDGLREGREDKINEEYKIWKAASDTIVKNNRAMTDEYKQVLTNRKLDIDQTMQMLELVAAKYQSQFDYEALRRKNLVDWDKNYQNHEKQADIIEKAIIYAEAQKEKAEAKRVQKDENYDRSVQRLAKLYRENGPNAIRPFLYGRNMEKIRADVMAEVDTQMKENKETDADMRHRWARNAGEVRAQSQIGTRVGNFGTSSRQFEELMQPLEAAIKNVSRSASTDFNTLTSEIRLRFGNAAEQQLQTAINALVNTYARVIAPTGQVHQTERNHARTILNNRMSKGQLQATIDQMKLEIRAEDRALQRSIYEVPELYRGPPRDGGGGSSGDGWGELQVR